MRKYLAILILSMISAVSFGQSINFPARLGKNDPADPYGIVRDNEIEGGWMSVNTYTDRNNIPLAQRKLMMVVAVQQDTSYWTLIQGITNSDWAMLPFSKVFPGTSTGGGSVTTYKAGYGVTISADTIKNDTSAIASKNWLASNYLRRGRSFIQDSGFITNGRITARSIILGDSLSLNPIETVKLSIRNDSTNPVFKVQSPASIYRRIGFDSTYSFGAGTAGGYLFTFNDGIKSTNKVNWPATTSHANNGVISINFTAGENGSKGYIPKWSAIFGTVGAGTTAGDSVGEVNFLDLTGTTSAKRTVDYFVPVVLTDIVAKKGGIGIYCRNSDTDPVPDSSYWFMFNNSGLPIYSEGFVYLTNHRGWTYGRDSAKKFYNRYLTDNYSLIVERNAKMHYIVTDSTIRYSSNFHSLYDAYTLIDKGYADSAYFKKTDTSTTVATRYYVNSAISSLPSTSYYLDRANHTGTQPISTVTNLQPALDNKRNVDTSVTALSIVSGTITWNLANSPDKSATVTLTSNITSFTINNPTTNGYYTLKIVQDGTGGRTITGWDSKIKWKGGTVPTITTNANATDIITFWYGGVQLNAIHNADFK